MKAIMDRLDLKQIINGQNSPQERDNVKRQIESILYDLLLLENTDLVGYIGVSVETSPTDPTTIDIKLRPLNEQAEAWLVAQGGIP